MKSQAQILRYISQCRFPNEDWLEVLEYCKKNFGGGKAHRALKPLSESTYRQFLDWIDNGIAVGDIVRYGHTLGIVGGYSPDAAFLSAVLSFDGGLVITKLEVLPQKLIKAQPYEIEKFNRILLDNKLAFTISFSSFSQLYIPADGDIVTVLLGNKETPAIYKSQNDKCYCFYVLVERKKVIADKEMFKDDVQLQPTTRINNLALLKALSVNGYKWSAKDKTLSKVFKGRLSKGSRYYYVTDTLDIGSENDNYTKLHDRRFKSGNYFSNFHECFYVRERMVELIKKVAEER